MRPPGLAASRIARLLTALAPVVVALVLVGSAPARAHTDLDFTLPTDGAAVGEPVAEITVGFTDPVTLVGSGFEVLDPAGAVVTPFVATDDDRVFLLQLDPPLAGGEAAVRYEVRAEDGHTITGGFAFTVTAEAPTTMVAPSTTSPVTTTTAAPSTAAPSTAATTTPVTTATTSTGAPDSSADPSVPPSAPESSSDDSGPSSGVYVGIAVAVAVAAAVFLVIRARSSAP